jgi:CIC family chloride channel protein
MQTDVETLQEGNTLAQAADRFAHTRRYGLPVIDVQSKLAGFLTVSDLEQAKIERSDAVQTVGDICTREVLITYPDEHIGQALQRMGVRDIGRLPVVSREDERELVGLLRRNDIIRAYELALTRRAAIRHRANQVRLGVLSGVTVDEITIEPGAPCAGKRINEIRWPRESVLATVRRRQKVIFLHGDVILHPGDTLVAVVDESAREELNRLCSSQEAIT